MSEVVKLVVAICLAAVSIYLNMRDEGIRHDVAGGSLSVLAPSDWTVGTPEPYEQLRLHAPNGSGHFRIVFGEFVVDQAVFPGRPVPRSGMRSSAQQEILREDPSEFMNLEQTPPILNRSFKAVNVWTTRGDTTRIREESRRFNCSGHTALFQVWDEESAFQENEEVYRALLHTARARHELLCDGEVGP